MCLRMFTHDIHTIFAYEPSYWYREVDHLERFNHVQQSQAFFDLIYNIKYLLYSIKPSH